MNQTFPSGPEVMPPGDPGAALARITIPDAALARITELMSPGASLIISDQGLGPETGKGTDFIVRNAVIMNDELTEIITFAPNQKVSFHQFKSPREGVIVNEILEDGDGELQLRFYAYLGLVGVTPGSEQERQAQAVMDSEDRGYKAAVLSTLARTRTLAEEGKL